VQLHEHYILLIEALGGGGKKNKQSHEHYILINYNA
jgi:hypothetical protein